MRTEGRCRGEGGFTLIEVLVAMVILAIGLLGLEALGIGAARSVMLANRRSELAVVAAGALEKKEQEIRSSTGGVATGQSCVTDAPSGFTVCTTVENRQTLASLPPKTARLTVRVSRPAAPADTFRITSNVFDPVLP